MKLLKPFTSTEFGTIPLTLSSITPNEFLGEYTVTDDADGVNGQIDVIIERTGDNYTDICLNELDISNVVDAKNTIKDIKIISQGLKAEVLKKEYPRMTSNYIWQGQNRRGYYMGTDVGYLRFIFYFGVFFVILKIL